MSEDRLEINGIERMYADELFYAVDRAENGSATVITKDGVPVALITPLAGPLAIATESSIRDPFTGEVTCRARLL